MNSNGFRKELIKTMPGYKWTVRRRNIYSPDNFRATGIQSKGFNRLSTLEVVRLERNGDTSYYVKSAGFGKRSPWLAENRDGTLVRALRGLQTHYENMASNYSSHAGSLQIGRVKK